MLKEDILQELKNFDDTGLLRSCRVIGKVEGPFVIIDGIEFLNFSSNDYLGLAQHPKVRESAESVLKEGIFGAASSRLLAGTTHWHQRLEMAIAEFKRQESAIVFTSGYMANIGLITSLADKDALILSDAFNHASIVDGCTLSKAKVIVYPHLDFRYVDRMLKENTNHKRRFIITESIFSMDGDIAPLPKLIEISKKSDATLIVDDAHAIGVLGKTGRGGLEYFALDEKDYIVVGTMSKAIGSIGGFVAGSNWIVEFIKNKARTLIYTTALPPIVCAAGICGIKLIEKEGWRRTKLIENISYIKKGLSKIGFSINSLPVPIIPIVIGNTRKALKLASYLWENKIFAPAIKPPTVPEGMCRIRLSISALFDKKHLSLLLEVLSKAIKII